ncbi:MAG: AAA family ATPase [Devosia sp.]|nr:AAA family ATPase [Devosia sp.]
MIRTRLRPPTRGAGLIEREKLDRIAGRIRQRRLVLVKAPAGYGKSSLLHRWHMALAQTPGTITGWLSLDTGLDDLRSFFSYTAAAIRESAPDFGAELQNFLESAREPTATRVASAFVNALMARQEHVVLFVDDFHLLTDKAAIRAVEMVVRDAPPNFHLVVASRQSPGFSLARLRMLGETDEIDVEELRFDADELDSFARLFGREPLAGDESERLLSATEGWAAGIQLALISLGQQEDVAPFLAKFTGEHRMVSEFLLDDVIENLTPKTVDFLLRTSILETFNSALCNEVVGIDNAEAQIAALSAQGLFIFSLDDERRWFRYHHLFSEMLQRILRDRLPAEVAELHRKASKWYETHGHMELAFSHAIRAEDWASAGQILESTCTDLFYEGKLGTLSRLASQVPSDVLNGLPRVQLELAWSIILEWRFDDATEIITRVERMLERWEANGGASEHIEDVRRIVLHRRMMLALFMDDVVELERSVLALLHDFPTDDPYLRGTLENCLIYARREMFRLDRVDQMDRAARDFFERSGSKFVLVWHEAILGPTFDLRGDTAMARKSLRSAMEIAEYVDGRATPLQAMPAMLLAEMLYETNELDEAEELISQLGPLTERLGFVDNLCSYFVTRSRLCQRRDDLEGAREAIAAGEASADYRGFSRLKRRMWLERVRMAVRAGDFTFMRAELIEAEEQLQQRLLTPGQHTIGQDEYFALGWSLMACQTGQAKAAVEVLRRWASFTGTRRAVRSEVRFLIALSSALSLAGERGEALRKMRQAVQKAAAPGYISSFLDAGAPVLGLLQELFGPEQAPTGPVSTFGVELLRMFSQSDPNALASLDTLPSHEPVEQAPPEALNDREREVLLLVSHGKANKDIARLLGMTEGTVKWYMQQVFSKLDVRRRSLAVRRARQHGLL